MSSQPTTWDAFERTDLSTLSPRQRRAWLAIREGDMGPREFQRSQGYASPGTVSNHLRRAEEKLADE